MSKVFRVVMGLWLAPDFTAVMEGKAEPPRINHSKVDFGELVTALRGLFPNGPHARIRVANDTVDQVTVHHRSGISLATSPTGSIRCEDFGHALLMNAASQHGDVIDVRRAWQALHSLADRNFAPPPVLIPFIIEAADFDDAMIWQASARPSLGLPFPGVRQDISGKPGGDRPPEGKLPEAVRKRLGLIFGCDFLPSAFLEIMAMDTPPKEYGL